MIPCSLDDTYGLMNIHWQHSQRGSLFLRVFTSICSHAHLPAQMRRKGRQIRCCRSSIVPTSTSLKLWRFDCLETRSACQKALCRPRKSTLSPHSQLVRFDMPVSQNTAPANKKKLHEGRRSAGKCKKTSSKRCACHEILTSRSVLTPPRSASILSEMPRLSRFGMVRVRFRPPVL